MVKVGLVMCKFKIKLMIKCKFLIFNLLESINNLLLVGR